MLSFLTACVIISTTVVVLPVPGGPCTIATSLWHNANFTACFCDSSRSGLNNEHGDSLLKGRICNGGPGDRFPNKTSIKWAAGPSLYFVKASRALQKRQTQKLILFQLLNTYITVELDQFVKCSNLVYLLGINKSAELRSLAQMHVIVAKCNKDNQPYRLLKCQSLSTTALFRTTATWKSIFHQLMIGLKLVQTFIHPQIFLESKAYHFYTESARNFRREPNHVQRRSEDFWISLFQCFPSKIGDFRKSMILNMHSSFFALVLIVFLAYFLKIISQGCKSIFFS